MCLFGVSGCLEARCVVRLVLWLEQLSRWASVSVSRSGGVGVGPRVFVSVSSFRGDVWGCSVGHLYLAEMMSGRQFGRAQ